MEVKAKEYYTGALTYNEIIMRHFDRIATSSSDARTFINHVETLDILMTPFKDKNWDEETQKEINDFLEETGLKGEDANIAIAKLKLRRLTVLAQEAGFIPPKMVEGVLDAEVIEKIFVEG